MQALKRAFYFLKQYFVLNCNFEKQSNTLIYKLNKILETRKLDIKTENFCLGFEYTNT